MPSNSINIFVCVIKIDSCFYFVLSGKKEIRSVLFMGLHSHLLVDTTATGIGIWLWAVCAILMPIVLQAMKIMIGFGCSK